MKKLANYWTIIFIVTLCFVACENNPPVDNIPQAQAPQQENSTTNAALETAGKNWPFTPEAEIKNIKPEYLSKVKAGNMLAKNYVLVFDGSASMNESECSGGLTKIEAAKIAVKEWIKSLPADANLGIVSFCSAGWTIQPMFNGDRAKFMATVDSINGGDGTPLTEAVWHAFRMLTEQGQLQSSYGEYIIVVITDGQANNPFTLDKSVNFIINNSPIQIYTIGFCISERHSLNQPGRTMYKSADNPIALRKGLAEVLAEAENFTEKFSK